MKKEIRTAEENIVSVLKGKRVLFLENDNGLSDYGGQSEFARILNDNGIECKMLFNLEDDYTMDQIVNEIMQSDAICFMTQWVYDIAKS